MKGLVSFDMCEGNPGAVAFMMAAYNPEKSMPEIIKAETAFKRMDEVNIRGSQLYMLWNDCCNRDTEKAIEIMKTKPIEEIVKHINFEGGRGYAFDE